MVVKKNTKKPQYWEVIAPEPFVIDTTVTDEQFISEMVAVSKSSEITELIHSYLQRPTKTFIIYCSESELKKAFNVTEENFKLKIEKQDKDWLLSVMNKDGEFIGRGEIVNIGNKITKDKINPIMIEHMTDFISKYEKGNTRIKSLMYKMDYLKSKMTTGNTILS